MKKTIIIIIAILLILAGIYYYQNNKPTQNPTNEVAATQSDKAAYITSIEGNKITLDFFDYLTGPAAVSAATAEGKCTEDTCLPNGDIYFKNSEVKSETFTLSPDATIVSTYAFEKSPTGEANITLSELKSEYVDKGLDSIGNEIKFNDKNEVVYIKQIFRP